MQFLWLQCIYFNLEANVQKSESSLNRSPVSRFITFDAFTQTDISYSELFRPQNLSQAPTFSSAFHSLSSESLLAQSDNSFIPSSLTSRQQTQSSENDTSEDEPESLASDEMKDDNEIIEEPSAEFEEQELQYRTAFEKLDEYSHRLRGPNS